jgi:hypothetical protein
LRHKILQFTHSFHTCHLGCPDFCCLQHLYCRYSIFAWGLGGKWLHFLVFSSWPVTCMELGPGLSIFVTWSPLVVGTEFSM